MRSSARLGTFMIPSRRSRSHRGAGDGTATRGPAPLPVAFLFVLFVGFADELVGVRQLELDLRRDDLLIEGGQHLESRPRAAFRDGSIGRERLPHASER